MKVGDKLTRVPEMWGPTTEKRRLPLPCTVVAVNQAHGHYTVRFETPGGAVLESYRLVPGREEPDYATPAAQEAKQRRQTERRRKKRQK